MKEHQVNATATETIRRRRKTKRRRRRRVYSCTYGAVLHHTRMAEVCVRACLCMCVSMSVCISHALPASVEGNDACDSLSLPSFTLSLVSSSSFCSSHASLMERGHLIKGELLESPSGMDRWIHIDQQTGREADCAAQAQLAKPSSASCLFVSFIFVYTHLSFPTSHSLSVSVLSNSLALRPFLSLLFTPSHSLFLLSFSLAFLSHSLHNKSSTPPAGQEMRSHFYVPYCAKGGQ